MKTPPFDRIPLPGSPEEHNQELKDLGALMANIRNNTLTDEEGNPRSYLTREELQDLTEMLPKEYLEQVFAEAESNHIALVDRKDMH